ncbi:ABC transporter permease [Nonomuraea jiangxiensis]|uniref:Simple sugar transport system permease protein n=1 Tax=Nonomuraea jiangxiensis TaxID=633440 RepID=A0A1G9Q8N9_9ACTN|nr:ABC transporter permease [Nonomuraea jiangxiensis]SDM06715.1 simple sugar transport system permease protein [Nonomuraea jiangxiensis]
MTQDTPRSHRILREISGGNAVVSVLAIGLALLVGSVLIVLTDPEVQAASGYLFARPADAVLAAGDAIGGACSALFQGAVFNGTRVGWANQIKPLTETLTLATPLIAAGLGVSVAFRSGLFNIGGRGQMLVAAAAAGWISWSFPMPYPLHMLVCVLGAVACGALWGGVAGVLKARTGAHEVIVTIMLNYVAFYLVSFLLRTPGALQAPGSNGPKSPAALDTAVMPTLSDLLGIGSFRLHAGFVLVVAATSLVWWVLNRSGLGFRFRAVGENPDAARVAGIEVRRVYLVAMMMSGGLAGLAGASQVLGTTTTGFGSGIDAGIGFDAITVALLGRSRPWGVFAGGLLFGALKTGGYAMQAAQTVPIDLILVVQAVIVLLIAAPPLVRAVFRLPAPAAGARLPRTPKAVTR